jgi:7,8-dihydropterin-6-yl-methyl-4-(beta-D-ribofuranosyl)aminobenzene 5'-phosphate synthase
MNDFIVLTDNNPHPSLDFKTEHGLSIYFEADGLKWLFDVGASDLFHRHALKLGIDIADVDYLVLSHGHNDHTGGLEHFLNINQKAVIIISAHTKGKNFVSNKNHLHRNIGMNQQLAECFANRLLYVDGDKKLSEHVNIISTIPVWEITPKANHRLMIGDEKGFKHDDFKHEIVLTVETGKGHVVLSGCSHRGILNILGAVRQMTGETQIAACIGGTHLNDSDAMHIFETHEELTAIARHISDNYKGMRFFTGHCTGQTAQHVFASVLGSDFSMFYSGAHISI